MSFWLVTLWMAGAFAKGSVIYRAIASKVSGFPVFVLFMSLALLRTVALMVAQMHGGAAWYREIFLATDKALMILEGFAGLEALVLIARLPNSWAVFVVFFCLAFVATYALKTASAFGAISDAGLISMAELNRNLGFAIGLSLICASTFFRLPGWQLQRLTVHGGAVAAMLLLPAIAYAFLPYGKALHQVVIVGGYAAACFYWVAKIDQPQPIEEAQDGPEMREVLRELAKSASNHG